MKLIALILGLLLEHMASELLHLRELRWFDRYFDYVLHRIERAGPLIRYLIIVLALAVPLLPVLWASLALLQLTVPWGLPYLVFTVLVVFFCLGPRDLGTEVDEYCAAVRDGDTAATRNVLMELLEAAPQQIPDDGDSAGAESVAAAVFAQATKRMFGVVFWFIAFGPAGAWLFRLSDLLRRRAVFELARDRLPTATVAAAESVHGLLAWLPARLAAAGYLLGGSFDHALQAWRSYVAAPGQAFYRRNDALAARVGSAAMAGFLEQPADSADSARHALRLVKRTLFIWVTVLALMTLFGWAV